MLNITEISRPKRGLSGLLAMLDPDIYVAACVHDFLESIEQLPFPWYKDFPLGLVDPVPRAYVVFNNVGLTRAVLSYPEAEPNRFLIHDGTGDFSAVWPDKNDFFGSEERSFERAHEEQGLTEDDWVSEVFLKCFLDPSAYLIAIVTKTRSPRREQETLAEKIARISRAFNPQLTPDPA